ncbi:hypothetical protein C5167_014481 [Papaver somniferum]|uniref:Uncharacterized protein n=1 Tax=Papaver somniferum TaxID=3469 RepID=A0A4Y7J6F5_PAPSO|nr:hypothetical protein C5167_014481 [Papaver somniferum]
MCFLYEHWYTSNEDVGAIEYQCESPDKQALVSAVSAYGYTSGHIMVDVNGEKLSTGYRTNPAALYLSYFIVQGVNDATLPEDAEGVIRLFENQPEDAEGTFSASKGLEYVVLGTASAPFHMVTVE